MGCGAGGYKDFAPDGAAANSNGVESFSPALADAIGLRRVRDEMADNSEGVASVRRWICIPLGFADERTTQFRFFR
jgi:hypothetical protein